jgi:hypothetical protein
MLYRSSSSAMGRVFSAFAALVICAGIADCTPYSSGARDGTLSPSLGFRSAARATLGEILSGAPGTYIDRILVDRDSTIERWPARIGDPLHIWIDSSAIVTGAQAEFPNAVRAAFAEWGTTGIPLRFAYVSSEDHADIRVHWTDHLDHKTGSTTWRTDRNGWLMVTDITLATHVSDGHVLDARGMRAIALHEVGHALGLSHSGDPQDVMAPLVRVDGLSLPDRNTIKLLYTLPAGHIR